MKQKVVNVSRRSFLVTSSVFVLGTTVVPKVSAETAGHTFKPNLFVDIGVDGVVGITSHRSEMGQGVRTAIAQIVADELDADWSNITVRQAPGDSAYGDQNTDGSKSMRMFFEPLRAAGASARQMLINAAAEEWGVPDTECTTNEGVVRHTKTGRELSYGQLASRAADQPVPKNITLKPRDQFKYIGKGLVHVDAENIATGQATFGADVSAPNMAVAVLVRGPSLHAKAKKVSIPEEWKHNKRFVGLVTIDPTTDGPIMFNPVGGVAVIAEDTYTAIKASNDLKVEWIENGNKNFNSEEFQATLRQTVQNPTDVVHESGNVDAAFEQAENPVERLYETAFLSHAPMEPPAAFADVREHSVTVYAPVQDPQSTRAQVAGWLNVDLNTVTVTPTLLGGAFGRKSKPDFVLEACELSKRLKRPIRVQWTREDDIHYDYFHASSAQYYKASLDENGTPNAWLQRTAFPSIMTTFTPVGNGPGPFELDMGFTRTPYICDNQRWEAKGFRAGVRIGWLRSVCNIFHAFGANVFVDELAHAAGIDPIDYRLAMWQKEGILKVPGMPAEPGHELNIGRLRDVLIRVRKLSDWDRKRKEGKAIGVAVHHSFYSYVATAIEVSGTASNLSVDRAYVALDCGTYVNSDTCVAQMEGAVNFGLSLALESRITVNHGTVQENNFDGYQVLRINEAPDIEVELVPSTELPAGVGEPGVPPVAPALANAVFALTGDRVRSLPIVG